MPSTKWEILNSEATQKKLQKNSNEKETTWQQNVNTGIKTWRPSARRGGTKFVKVAQANMWSNNGIQ